MKRLVTGIFAHVDSGKTTLSEAILYNCGEIRSLGRVDHRNSFLDNHFIERDRGITVFSKQAVFRTDECEFTLLDTPGHIDFSAEAERAMQILDYAVLIVSAADGVQGHTETLWSMLRRYNIPVFIFVNKMDSDSADKQVVLKELKKRLSDSCVDFSIERDSEEFYDSLAVCDENMLEEMLSEEKISDEQIRAAIFQRKIFPCCFGSALKNDKVTDFIDILDKFTQCPAYSSDFGAKVYKITEDEQGNRLTHLKVTGGVLKVKDLINGITDGEQWSEKVNRIRIYSGAKFSAVDSAECGTVCAVTGLSRTFQGQGLGIEKDSDAAMTEPVLTYKVEFPKDIDNFTALSMLRKIEEEEPQLHVLYNEQLKEIHIQPMGEVQLEILRSIVKKRFNTDISFSQGSIAYKETIANIVEGIGHYEPLKHYAEVHLLLEPMPRGSGITLACDCSEDILDKNYQRLILTHLAEKKHIGVLTGSPITDIKITVASGKAHLKHTEGGDFRQATYRAVRHGLRKAESILLEPFYNFTLEIPSECTGRAMNDIQQMCGELNSPETLGENVIIRGSAPVSELWEYQQTVTAYTKGRGKLTCTLKGYEPCHNTDEVTEKIGYNPDCDIDNSADSVFCSHGAGFVVKWNEVEEHMHLESVLKPKAENELQLVTPRRINEFRNRLVEDKELMEIFERTYGKINRDSRTALYTEKNKEPAPKTKAKPVPKGPEYLLVDGYNIIFAWDELKKIAADNLDAARSQLINILCNYQGFRQCELILVFDAYKVKNNKGEIEKVHNISVVYTKEAETADSYIERVTHELSKNHRVRVATSDNLEQMIILGNGAYRMSAKDFYLEVKEVEKAIREFIK